MRRRTGKSGRTAIVLGALTIGPILGVSGDMAAAEGAKGAGYMLAVFGCALAIFALQLTYRSPTGGE